MNDVVTIEENLLKLGKLYADGDEKQKYAIATLLEEILSCKSISDIHLQIDKIDQATNLPNREALMKDIVVLQDEAMLIMLHINQLEPIKQLYGFEIAREVIIDKSKKLQDMITEEDVTLYSLNLQKFAILVKNRTLFEKYLSILNYYIFNNMDNNLFCTTNGEEIISDFTAGISYGNEHLHHMANVALQEAISLKERYRVYENDPEYIFSRKAVLNKHQVYKEALHNGCIVPYFQPIIDATDGSVTKYEALARLKLFDGTIITPYDFLDAAIEDNTFEFFTRQMMQKVFLIYEKCSAEISINLTYKNLKSQSMLDYIKNRLDKYGGDRITFEIVETEEIDDYEVVEKFIEMIKEYGSKISIDDFGSGYSNFTNLIKLHIDFLKIDGTLVSKVLVDEKAKFMVKGLIEFSKKIKIKTVAEFVSSYEIAECVRELGVDYFQGYYYGEPKEALFYGLE